MKFSH